MNSTAACLMRLLLRRRRLHWAVCPCHGQAGRNIFSPTSLPMAAAAAVGLAALLPAACLPRTNQFKQFESKTVFTSATTTYCSTGGGGRSPGFSHRLLLFDDQLVSTVEACNSAAPPSCQCLAPLSCRARRRRDSASPSLPRLPKSLHSLPRHYLARCRSQVRALFRALIKVMASYNLI
jgi:hypothetical protein